MNIKIKKLSLILIFLLTMTFFTQSGFTSKAQAVKGGFAIQIGDSMGLLPTGSYVDSLNDIAYSKSIQYSVKYTLNIGLILGLEEMHTGSRIDDGTNENVLFISSRSLLVGWTPGGDRLRFSIEAGVPLTKATISIRESELSILGGESEKSQEIDSFWGGISLDWGFMEKDGNGIGITFHVRYFSLTTDDLFETGNDFTAGTLNFGGCLRYRF